MPVPAGSCCQRDCIRQSLTRGVPVETSNLSCLVIVGRTTATCPPTVALIVPASSANNSIQALSVCSLARTNVRLFPVRSRVTFCFIRYRLLSNLPAVKHIPCPPNRLLPYAQNLTYPCYPSTRIQKKDCLLRYGMRVREQMLRKFVTSCL